MKKVESTISCVSAVTTDSCAGSTVSSSSGNSHPESLLNTRSGGGAAKNHPESVLDTLSGSIASGKCKRMASLVISTLVLATILVGLVRLIPLTSGFGPEDDLPHNDLAEWVILFLGTNVCFFNGLVAVPVFLLFIRARLRQGFGLGGKSDELGERLIAASIAVVIPCYMPNEQGLIKETVEHVRSELQHAGPLTVYVTYNTPKVLPIERELQTLEIEEHPSGRRLIVLKVEGSTSKAENLNAVMDLIDDEYTVIYDADHHPDAGSLQRLLHELHVRKADCIQGSTYLRNHSSSFMARIIDAEFYACYFVMFTALQFVARTGFFGGSNALWRTESLKCLQFDKHMQTEDIDFATRSIISGKKIRFCPEARSGELAPSSVSAVFKQRIRWAMGWDQVSINHVLRGSVLRAPIPLSRRIGVMYALGPMRWFLAALSMFGALAMPMLASSYPPSSWPLSIACVFKVSFIEFVFVFATALLESLFHEEPAQCLVIAMFLACGPLYVLFQTGMLVVSLFRIMRGQTSGWVVTQRSGPLMA